MKRYAIYLFFFLLMCSLLAVLSEQRKIAQIVAGKITLQAKEQGVLLYFQNPRLALIGLNVDKLEIGIPRYALGFDLGRAKIRFSLLSLLNLSDGSALRIKAEPYLGDLELLLDNPTKNMQIVSTASKLDLSKHPQALGLGISAGTLSYHLDLLVDHINGQEHSGTIEIIVDELEQSQQIRLPAQLTGIPGDLTIPTFEIESLRCKLSLETGVVSTEDCLLDSSLLKLDLNGEVRPRARSLLLRGKADLTKESMDQIGELLRLFSNGRLVKGQSSFNWRYSQTGAIQNFEIVN